MWDIIAAPLIKGIGGLFGRKSEQKAADRQAEEQRKANATRIQTTVKDALAAGINPLTAIAGGAVPQAGAVPYVPPLSTASFIADAISESIEETRARKAAEADETAKSLRNILLQQEVERGKREASRTRGFGYDLTHVEKAGNTGRTQKVMAPALVAPAAVVNGVSSVRPQMRPQAQGREGVPVFHPTGKGEALVIPREWAERLDVQPWTKLMLEDLEAMTGEIPSETVAVTEMVLIHKNNGLPLPLEYKQKTPEEKARKKTLTGNPWYWLDRYNLDSSRGPQIPNT